MGTKPGQTNYSDETRAICRELWAIRASQSPARTVRILATEYPDLSPIPTDETIRYWRDTEDWAGWLAAEVAKIAGGLHLQAVVDQLTGGPEAIAYLRLAVNDEHLDAKLRIQAAVALADRSGYSPLGRNPKPQLESRQQLPALASMTAEEAIQYERDLIDATYNLSK